MANSKNSIFFYPLLKGSPIILFHSLAKLLFTFNSLLKSLISSSFIMPFIKFPFLSGVTPLNCLISSSVYEISKSKVTNDLSLNLTPKKKIKSNLIASFIKLLI